MAFLEDKIFPTRISIWMVGSNQYHTSKAEIAHSGRQKRNIDRDGQLARFKISDDRIELSGVNDFTDFFNSAKGMGNPFRVLNPFNYSASGSEGTLVEVAAGVQWQMYKTDADGNSKKILKPISGTVAVSGTGTYTVDHTTGLVDLVSGSAPTGWTGDFHLPCTFDADEYDFGRTNDGAFYSIGGIGLIEVDET